MVMVVISVSGLLIVLIILGIFIGFVVVIGGLLVLVIFFGV